MVKRIICFSFLVIVILCFGSCGKGSDALHSGSTIQNRVIDSANQLSQAQEESIFSLIQELEKHVGSQVAVLVVNSLNGRDLNQYSIQIAEGLALGRELYKDGILITLAYQDRKARIEVGHGLEKILKDEVVGRILDEKAFPKFKEDKVYEGLYETVDTIKRLIEENKKLVGQKP